MCVCVCVQIRNGKRVAVMLKVSKEGSNLFLVHRPNTGLQARAESIKHLLKKYYKVSKATTCYADDCMKIILRRCNNANNN